MKQLEIYKVIFLIFVVNICSISKANSLKSQFSSLKTLKSRQSESWNCLSHVPTPPTQFCTFYVNTNRNYTSRSTNITRKIENYLQNIKNNTIIQVQNFDFSAQELSSVIVGPFQNPGLCRESLYREIYNFEDIQGFCNQMVANNRSYENIFELNRRFLIFKPKTYLYWTRVANLFFDRTEEEKFSLDVPQWSTTSQCNEFYRAYLSEYFPNFNGYLDFCQNYLKFERRYNNFRELLTKFSTFVNNTKVVFLSKNFDKNREEVSSEKVSFTTQQECETQLINVQRFSNFFCRQMVLFNRTYSNIEEVFTRLTNCVNNSKHYKLDHRFFDQSASELRSVQINVRNKSSCKDDAEFVSGAVFNEKIFSFNFLEFCELANQFNRNYSYVVDFWQRYKFFAENVQIIKKMNSLQSYNATFKVRSKFFDNSQQELVQINPGMTSVSQDLVKSNSTDTCGISVNRTTLLQQLDTLKMYVARNSQRRSPFLVQLNETQIKLYMSVFEDQMKRIVEKLDQGNYTNKTGLIDCDNSNQIKLTHDLLPSALNFLDLGIVDLTVDDQLECGACWVFSISGMLESKRAFKTKTLPKRYSRQQLLDCVSPGSCNGGNHIYALQYSLSNPLFYEEDYRPYSGSKEQCSFVPKQNIDFSFNNYVSNFKIHKRLTAPELKFLLLKGPVAVGIDAKRLEFVFASFAPFRYDCNSSPNHSVLLVGWGNYTDGRSYWIIKNSWGTSWGDVGYSKIEMSDDWDACGMYSNVVEFIE